jgi:hypothetical protein
MVLLVPLVVSAPAQEPALIAIVQVVMCGAILGIGRQGIDLILLRLFVVASALLVGTLLGQLKQGHISICSGSVDCLQPLILGILGFGLYGTVVLALVSLPVTMIWNRGAESLRPEFHWPIPKTWWQGLLLLLSVGGVIFVSGVVLGVPWPA